MSRLAILLCDGEPTREHLQLARILDFFGVPWETVEVSKLSDVEQDAHDHVVFGLAETAASALQQIQRASHSVGRQAEFYVYTGDNRDASEHGLQSLSGNADLLLRPAPSGYLALRVSHELTEIAGPMAGLEISLPLRRKDAVLAGVANEESGFATIISVGDAPVFVRFENGGIPVYFCASSHMIDIDQTIDAGFYDVKDHFCSVVPLVMFVRLMFPDVAWRPQELSACLIIDDPLLRKRYGFCDFGMLLNLMRRYGFTTNIAFIPWNWRRTSAVDGEFFRTESEHFSVSIHGCDHIDSEFGETSRAILNDRAQLAQSRMRNHEARTGIHHDPVMVFPQGVFSSVCPEVLKHKNFLAAVNTEVVPTDCLAGTQISDVWDVAIMKYSCFPIFTRRYVHHGLENFAFDSLLGKPCLIVSHHEFFKDDCAALIEFIEKLLSLNCNLRWRPLGEVIRRACRRRVNDVGVEEVEMYGNELLVPNPSEQAMNVHVRKRESQPHLVAEVKLDGKPIAWSTKGDHVFFNEKISPHSDKRVQVVYRDYGDIEQPSRSLSFEFSVTARRILSEIRDEYLHRAVAYAKQWPA